MNTLLGQDDDLCTEIVYYTLKQLNYCFNPQEIC